MFNWFNKKKTAPPENKRTLFGYDLDKYIYLGAGPFSFVDKNDVVTQRYVAHYFCSRDNDKIRGVYIPDPYAYKTRSEIVLTYVNHNYYLHTILPWKSGEGSIYKLVKEPSDELKDIMMEMGNWVWCDKTKWWAPASESQKYAYAKSLQEEAKNEKSPSVSAVSDNVVEVNFGKKK